MNNWLVQDLSMKAGMISERIVNISALSLDM